jgi:hypothetical protein
VLGNIIHIKNSLYINGAAGDVSPSNCNRVGDEIEVNMNK